MNKSICSIEDYKKEELYELAFYDQVTGLTNEKYFYKYLKKKIEKTNKTEKFAILYLKIQNMDKLNNMIGYKSLNNLINKIYKIVSESITNHDIISIYRGEQFFLLFSIEETDKLYSVIDKKINYLVDNLKSYILKSGYNYLLNVNIGLSIYPLHSENAEDLISKAHHAMTLVDINKYDYKIYNKESFINKLDRESIKKDLEKAMKRKELFLNFQPKVKTDNKNIVSVEALIRWKHPQKGDISPGKFIPMAEKSGFIKKIGVWCHLAV